MASLPSTTAAGPSQNKFDYRKDIDGLRAIAVICVIVNHLYHAALPGGYLGVDIFFVISGYVITSSLEKTTYSSLGSQLLHFYSRRIKRLMPALITMVLVSSAVIRLFDPDALISSLTGLASIFGFSNFFLYSQAVNYFGVGAQRNVFSHTWSLGVEEQFYLLYPFLIRWRKPLLSNSIWEDRFRIGALVGISAVSLGLFIFAYGMNQPAAYFLMPCRFWELGMGCLMALIARTTENSGIGQPIRINSVFPLLAMVPPLFLGGKFPVVCTVIVVIATALLIGSVRKQTIVYRALAAPAPTYVGAISYSLYLWHWPVICISFWTIGIHAWSVPFQIAIMLLLSMASYHFIENPLRRKTWVGGRWGVLAIGVPAMACAAMMVNVGQRHGFPRFSGSSQEKEALNSPTPGYVSRYSNRKVDDCFAKSIFDGKDDLVQSRLERCAAKTDAGLELIFIGDSLATDLLPMSDQLYKDGVATVLNVTQPGCKAPAIKTDEPICNYPDRLLKTVASTGSPRKVLVIRTNYAPRRLNGDLSDFEGRLKQFLTRTSEAGMKVIYMAPPPKYYSVDSLCTPQWFRPKWAMSPECLNGYREDRAEELARRSDVMEFLTQLSKQRKDFFVFDPFDTLCGSTGAYCTPIRNGELIYRDGVHITARGSEMMAAPFESFLKESGLEPDLQGSGTVSPPARQKESGAHAEVDPGRGM